MKKQSYNDAPTIFFKKEIELYAEKQPRWQHLGIFSGSIQKA